MEELELFKDHSSRLHLGAVALVVHLDSTVEDGLVGVGELQKVAVRWLEGEREEGVVAGIWRRDGSVQGIVKEGC